MKRALAVLMLLWLPGLAAAATEGGGLMYHFEPNVGNTSSLQRGARDFMNYCSGCHSLQYIRYQRLSEDLGIPENLVQDNLMFTDSKMLDPVTNAMSAEKAEVWFGQAPPDLSLVARYRGAGWIYNYLRTYYVDPERPTGVNNLTYPQTAMPHVLWDLQGWQKAEYETAEGGEEHLKGLTLAIPGDLSPREYAQTVADITNFLVYVGEPMKMDRISLGVKVIIFLVLFAGLAYMLKREFWKDIH